MQTSATQQCNRISSDPLGQNRGMCFCIPVACFLDEKELED